MTITRNFHLCLDGYLAKLVFRCSLRPLICVARNRFCEGNTVPERYILRDRSRWLILWFISFFAACFSFENFLDWTPELCFTRYGNNYLCYAGDSWSHSCTNRLILYWNGNDRYAYLDKSPSLPVASAPYAVTGKGVRDAVSSNHKRVRVT